MTPNPVILSPHFDDAVLSCWHLVEGGRATVATVFSGVPEPGTEGWWDRLTGATDSVQRMHERRAENAEALALGGADGLTLDLLDEQYRSDGHVQGLEGALMRATRAADVVYAPLGLFLSADHRIVRDAALKLDADVRLYADHPHAGVWGLPGWVTGSSREQRLDVDGAWRAGMLAAGLAPDSLRADVHALDDAAFERKLEAVRVYRTQLAALECEAPLDQLRWEVTWTR
jgi:hypothetical protein